ncbi:Hemerythrin HHE cation binding domain protein [compost metagenome]
MIDLMGPAPGFDTPLAMLSACHRRIERRLEQLFPIAERLADPGPERHAEALRVLSEVRRHFATAGVHHTDDEELTLFPMLRASSDASLHELLDLLEKDHEVIDAMHVELEAIADRLQAGVTAADVQALQLLAVDLKVHYDRHIRQEDEHILPVASARLTPKQIAHLGFEMRRRRGV